MEDFIKYYNCGDFSVVIFNYDIFQLFNFINIIFLLYEQVMVQEIDSYFCQEFIYKRNECMGKRVMVFLWENEDKICFFVFGVGYFLGNNIVIDILWQVGLEVDYIFVGQVIYSFVFQSLVFFFEGILMSLVLVILVVVVFEVFFVIFIVLLEDEDLVLFLYFLFFDSFSQLEEFGWQRKWYKRQSIYQWLWQFNDFWVCIEDSIIVLLFLLFLQFIYSFGMVKFFFQFLDQL